MKKNSILGAVAVILAVAPSALAATWQTALSQPTSVYVQTTADGCTNNPGPFITMTGEIRLGGIDARIVLTNNARWTHVTSADVTGDAVLVPAGESIQIAKQPPLGGVGGNPHIYLQFSDCAGNALSGLNHLGRCVQGLRTSSLLFDLPTDATLTVEGGSCANSPGPFVTLSGELRLGGLCGTIVMSNNAKLTHVAEEDVTVDLVLIPAGESLTFAKQPPLGGAGGNPHVWVELLDGSGAPTTDPMYLGRCTNLGD